MKGRFAGYRTGFGATIPVNTVVVQVVAAKFPLSALVVPGPRASGAQLIVIWLTLLKTAPLGKFTLVCPACSTQAARNRIGFLGIRLRHAHHSLNQWRHWTVRRFFDPGKASTGAGSAVSDG